MSTMDQTDLYYYKKHVKSLYDLAFELDKDNIGVPDCLNDLIDYLKEYIEIHKDDVEW